MIEAPNCLVCGVPAETLGGHEMTGVDFDGREALFWVWTIQCVMGHRYAVVDETRTVKI